jgi:hypothetical protein
VFDGVLEVFLINICMENFNQATEQEKQEQYLMDALMGKANNMSIASGRLMSRQITFEQWCEREMRRGLLPEHLSQTLFKR